jgi:hypothetical protein
MKMITGAVNSGKRLDCGHLVAFNEVYYLITKKREC